MHILLTVNAAWNVWNFRRGLIRSLLTDGHTVTILAPADGSEHRITEMGCAFVHLDMSPSGMNPLREARLLQTFYQHFKELQPDIILGYTIKNNIFGAQAAKALAIPFLPNITGLGAAYLGNALMQSVARLLYRVAFRKLSIVFFQNEDDRNLFCEQNVVSNQNSRILPGSGINLTEFNATPLPTSDQGMVFLMVSRLLRDKGMSEFIEAAGRTKRQFPDAKFKILGPEGSANPSAIPVEDIEKAEKQGWIEYLGSADDVKPHIANAHCVVLPSYREGAPRALIEAAALGRPLIAADVPGSRAVIDHNRTGLLCAVKSPASLAAAFHSFLELTPSQRQEMGRAGRLKMQREYDERLVIAAYRAAITELIPEARKAG